MKIIFIHSIVYFFNGRFFWFKKGNFLFLYITIFIYLLHLSVPLTEPTLTILPELAEVSEGDQLYLICGTKGSPPVTFKFYRVGDEQPKFTTTSNINHTHYRVNELTKGHGGTYYCEAINQANNVFSERVTVEGETDWYLKYTELHKYFVLFVLKSDSGTR